MQIDLIILADFLGWAAVAFTLAAFAMRTMLPLRVAAIGANMFFIGYAHLEGALPIFALHAILLPFNAVRLRQLIRIRCAIESQHRDDLRKPPHINVASRPPHSAGANKREAVLVFKLWNGQPFRKF